MLRSLFAGISGLRSHQTMMDVTGNNIANVNTSGFKSSAVVFEDALSQSIRTAAAAGANTAAQNPAQVGLGVKTAGTSVNFTQGNSQLTNRTGDMLIQGEGFFIIDNAGQQAYTRAGSMASDSAGRLTSADGGLVQGWMGTNGVIDQTQPTGALTIDSTKYASYSLSPDGTLVGILASDGSQQNIGRIAIAKFSNVTGLEKVGGSLYRATANSGAAQVNAPGSNGMGVLVSGALEMSNVDLAQELTNLIIAQRGFQANSKIISTSDELLQDLMNLKR
ncbi:flagellar hook-basal body complex protein [Actinokineospora enzanensis]|uniref:flagellar hook-basal body complex protein n=1 Tax=Actinokineospora enzanensis TaxID=155975 RepID=UPI000379DF2F|nr:flagellar hook-basal body complex protein [Actinokineospora enzanensis]